MQFSFLTLVILPVLALIAVLAGIPLARARALRSGFVDTPGGRKDHVEAVPPVGGLVIFPVVMVLSFFGGQGPVTHWPLWLALLILLALGALDDRMEVRASLKFGLQALAALLIVVPGGAQVETLGDLLGFGEITLGWMSIPFSWFCTLLLVNSINMMDGLDGLAGGKSLIILAWFALAAASGGAGAAVPPLLVLMAGLAGFLFYNMRHPWRERACVFMGDSGSTALGLMLAWYSITLSAGPHPALIPMAVAWIVALPVIDTFSLFTGRIARGRHPFDPDRRHFHHHFVHAGIPAGKAVAAILCIGVVSGAIGLGGMMLGVPEPVLFYVWAAALALHTFASIRHERFVAFLRRRFAKEQGLPD